MEKLKKFSLLFMLCIATAGMISCEEEEEDYVYDNCSENLESLANTLVNASNTFSNNPTVSNCNSVRNAALNLIDAAENCEYGYLYEDQAEFWLDYDCSVFE